MPDKTENSVTGQKIVQLLKPYDTHVSAWQSTGCGFDVYRFACSLGFAVSETGELQEPIAGVISAPGSGHGFVIALNMYMSRDEKQLATATLLNAYAKHRQAHHTRTLVKVLLREDVGCAQ